MGSKRVHKFNTDPTTGLIPTWGLLQEQTCQVSVLLCTQSSRDNILWWFLNSELLVCSENSWSSYSPSPPPPTPTRRGAKKSPPISPEHQRSYLEQALQGMNRVYSVKTFCKSTIGGDTWNILLSERRECNNLFWITKRQFVSESLSFPEEENLLKNKNCFFFPLILFFLQTLNY